MKEIVEDLKTLVSNLFIEIYDIAKPIVLLPLSWMFSFTESQEERIKSSFKENSNELWSWTILTALLPILTFVLAASVNILFINYQNDEIRQLGKILNNGSLPIIAYGILTSCVPFLVEKLKMEKEDEEDDIFHLRKRVMSVATLLISLTFGIFLIQSITIVSDSLDSTRHLIVLSISIILTIYSVVVGRKMFILQSGKINPPVDKKLSEGTQQHTNSLNEKYG